MDDKTQPVQQSPQGGTLVQFPNGSASVVLPASDTPATPQNQVPVAPVGVPKEQEPFPSKPLTQEFIAPSEQPVEIEPDLEQAGISETSPTPDISEELKQAGIVTTGTAAPLPVAPKLPEMKLPIDPEKAKAVTKGSFLFKNPSSSLLWLAMLVLRQLKMKEKGKGGENSHAA